MSDGFLSLFFSWITAASTFYVAYYSKRKDHFKYKNAKKKLKTVLVLSVEECEYQIDVLETIFVNENQNVALEKVQAFNALAIKSYIDDLMLLTNNSVNEYIAAADCDLDEKEIKSVLDFSNLLKNVFAVTNMIKERAHGVDGVDNKVTILKYGEYLMSGLPEFLRSENSSGNEIFGHALLKLENRIEGDWQSIQKILEDSEVKRGISDEPFTNHRHTSC